MTITELKARGIYPKTCLFIMIDDFRELLEDAGIPLDVSIEMDGIAYHSETDEDWTDDKINQTLGEFLGVKITSIHADDCDYPGIWIVYKDKEEGK